jgi:hypothetical protein
MTKPTIPVDAEALHQVLQALIGPSHHVRELQATRGLHKLGAPYLNPIETLVEQWKAWSAAQLPKTADTNTSSEEPAR